MDEEFWFAMMHQEIFVDIGRTHIGWITRSASRNLHWSGMCVRRF